MPASDSFRDPFREGVSVYVVMRTGEILQGYRVASRLLDLVTLDRSPLDGGSKQGFTVEGELLLPNWCAGRREIIAVVSSHEKGLEILAARKRPPVKKKC